MGSAKSGSKVEIAEYTMSIHMGICAYGSGIELVALKYGDEEMWRGSVTDQTTFSIDKPDLFGGVKKEGGVKGLAWWLPGASGQTMPQSLASRLGLTTATCPGFRGLASVFFTGVANVGESAWQSLVNALMSQPSKNKSGFYWAANNPYLRDLSARVRRMPVSLGSDYSRIRMPDDSNGNVQYAANPAHIIYECLTDTDWGMGESEGVIDKASFTAAAQTLYSEGFGLNMKWSRQNEIGKFIGEVLNHIYAMLYINPETGKHTIKLLRADYDVASLPEINEGNAVLSSFSRKAWGEIVNEVVVTLTNSESGESETVTAQDLAGIAAQGAITSTSKDYYGVTSSDLALRLAERDLAISVNPIATCEAEVSQVFWDSFTGSLVKLSWPEYDIDQIVFRVSEVTNGSNSVKLTLYEDIFGLDYATYRESASTEWQNPNQPPEPATYYQLGTAPAFMTAAILGKNDPSELEYPEAITSLNVAADSDDDINFDVTTYVTDVNGTTSRRNIGTRSYLGTFALTAAITPAAQTLLTSLPGLRGVEPDAGYFILFGTGTDEFTEICTVQSIDENGYLLNRGVLDTVPRSWPIGTRGFIIQAASIAADPTIRSSYEAASYWLQTRTKVNVLPLEDTPQLNITLSERPYLPNRPANVKVNGVGFGTADATGLATVPITWANRNRTLESTQVMKWTDATVAGEAGQTTRIVVRSSSGTVLATYPGLTGTSYDLPVNNLGQNNNITIALYAENGAKLSLQGFSVSATITPTPRLVFEGDQSGAIKFDGRDGYLQLEGAY